MAWGLDSSCDARWTKHSLELCRSLTSLFFLGETSSGEPCTMTRVLTKEGHSIKWRQLLESVSVRSKTGKSKSLMAIFENRCQNRVSRPDIQIFKFSNLNSCLKGCIFHRSKPAPECMPTRLAERFLCQCLQIPLKPGC